METRQNIADELLGDMVHVVVDRPLGYRHNDTVYPINYGYIPGIIAGDGEEQDAYIWGVTQPVASFDGRVVAVIHRKDDCEDKLVVAPDGILPHQAEIVEAVHFQEKYFVSTIHSLFQKSCGVIPYRIIHGTKEYLIVFEQYSQCWSFPKGHMEAGETESQTALRELYEETGLTAVLDTSSTASIEYPVSPIARKQVVFFLGEVCGLPRIRDGEVEHFLWVKAEELKDYLFPDTVKACAMLIN